MEKQKNSAKLPLPHGWPERVKSAMLHVTSLAQYAVAYTRGWAVNSRVARVFILGVQRWGGFSRNRHVHRQERRLERSVALLRPKRRITFGMSI